MTLCLCSLLAATREFSIPIGQKMQLTGWDNRNEMRNATCVGSKTSIYRVALLSVSYTVTLPLSASSDVCERVV